MASHLFLQFSGADGTMELNPPKEKHWSNKSKAGPKMQFDTPSSYLIYQIINNLPNNIIPFSER